MMENVQPIDTAPGKPQGSPALTPKQRRTIAAILAARTYEEAITAAKVTRQTFYNYFKLPHFKSELDRQLNEFTNAALDRLKGASAEAVQALRALLNSENEHVRLRASQAIIDYTIKAKELGELSARLDVIEQKIEAQK